MKGRRLFAQVPVRAAGDRALQLSAVRVLIAICGYANNGAAFPSLPTISAETGIDIRNLPAVITALERSGYLRRAGWHQGRDGRSRKYEVIYAPTNSCGGMTTDASANSFPRMSSDAPANSFGDMTSCPGMTSCHGMFELMPRHDETAPKLMPGHDQTDQVFNRPRTDQESRRDKDPLQQAVALWNKLAAERGLPRVDRLTDQRSKKLAARLRECGGLNGWREALRNVEAQPFLLGAGQRGWKADFDFLLQPTSFARVMEGRYASHLTSGRSAPSRRGKLDWLAAEGASNQPGDPFIIDGDSLP